MAKGVETGGKEVFCSKLVEVLFLSTIVSAIATSGVLFSDIYVSSRCDAKKRCVRCKNHSLVHDTTTRKWRVSIYDLIVEVKKGMGNAETSFYFSF